MKKNLKFKKSLGYWYLVPKNPLLKLLHPMNLLFTDSYSNILDKLTDQDTIEVEISTDIIPHNVLLQKFHKDSQPVEKSGIWNGKFYYFKYSNGFKGVVSMSFLVFLLFLHYPKKLYIRAWK